MANIKKSFNFRNGVQVDEDNLLVTPTGLVGIGTTVPTEALDVVGNVIVSGVTSTTLAQTGILTVTTLHPTEIIGSGVSISSGVITSTGGGGIVTFFGDGQYLENLPTTQFVSSATGIALTSQNCGIGTTNAISTLQVGGDPNTQPKGVGISSYGDVKATGIITASSFVGSFTGNVTGNISGNAPTATLADDAVKLQTPRNIGGVPFDGSANISLPGVNQSGNQNTSGTASNLSGSPSITVSGVDLNGNLDVSGNTTLGNSSSDTLSVNATPTFQTVIEAPAGMNKVPSLYANQGALPSAASYHGMFAHVHATGRGYFAHAGNWLELVNKETTGIVGTGTETYNVGLLGVGVNSPANDIQVRKNGNAEIQVTSETGVAGLTLGRETGVLNTNNAEIRYGANNLGFYSSEQSLDIINHGTGNFNYHLSANDPNAYKGDFNWHRGINNERLMTLTGIGGSIGLGTTLPLYHLDIRGDGGFSSDLRVGNDLTVIGALTVPSINSNVTGNVLGDLDGNVNSTGISTFNNFTAGITTFTTIEASQIGIGTEPYLPLAVNGDPNQRFVVSPTGKVGIKTSETQGMDLLVVGSSSQLILGVGTTEPLSTVDFSIAGQNIPTGNFANKSFMIPPKLNNSQKGSLTGLTGGALIYNTSLNKLEVYNGSAWTALEANSGGGEVNQNAFSNIVVSGQTTVEADAASDTVTFVGGSNMTITTNATGDEITFASSGGGGGSGISNLVEDLTPELGGDLETNGKNILIEDAKQLRFLEEFTNGTNYIGLNAPASLNSIVNYTLPPAYGSSGSFMRINAATGELDFTSTISESSVTGDVTLYGNDINDNEERVVFNKSANELSIGRQITTKINDFKIRIKTVATNATINNYTSYVEQNSLLIENSSFKDMHVQLSAAGKLTIGERDNNQAEVFRVQCSQPSNNTDGLVQLSYVDGDVSSGNTKYLRLATQLTGVRTYGTLVNSGDIIPLTDSTNDLGRNTVKWANVYADTLHGDGSNIITSTWGVTASGNNYRFTGPGNLNGTQNHPKLYLVRGQKYQFDLNVSGHPFRIRISDQGADYTGGVTTVGDTETGVITFDVPMDAPDVLYYQCNQHPTMIGTIDIASPPKQIQTLQGTTTSIADNVYQALNITGYKVYSLFKIATNHDALVRVYVDSASRNADISRSEGQDPNPGIGLIAEARTSGGTVLVTPGAMGFNNDNPQENIIYVGVTNRSGGTQQIQVTLTAIQIGE